MALLKEVITVLLLLASSAAYAQFRRPDVRSSPEYTRLMELLASHPKPEMQELGHLIQTSKIGVKFQTRLGYEGAEDKSPAAFVVAPIPGYGLVPIFLMTPHFLSKPDKICWRTLWHEYQHYLQWRDKKYPKHSFLPTNDEPLTREKVKALMHSEVDAYEPECVFAREINTYLVFNGPYVDVCKYYESGGRKEVARWLTHAYTSTIPAFKPFRAYMLRLVEKEKW